MAKSGSNDKDIIYVGIDLGTSRSAISTSSGIRKTCLTVVGYPRDVIAQRFLGKSECFGEEALKNSMSLEVIYPMEKGVLKYSTKGSKEKVKTKPEETEDDEAKTPQDMIKASKEEKGAKDIIRHLISLAESAEGEAIYGVIGAPSQASVSNKQTLIDATEGHLDAVMVVSEPFTVSYKESQLNNCLVIDIGAGTVDVCRVHGTIPSADDQISLFKAGDYIDNQLLENIRNEIDGAQLTKNMVKQWKDVHAFVGSSKESIKVTFPVNGVPQEVDLADIMRKSCETLLPDLLSSIRELISGFDPEFQEEMRSNILLAGGGSQIKGLARAIEHGLSDIGGAKVRVIDDPIFAGADGALKLAQEMPKSYWQYLK